MTYKNRFKKGLSLSLSMLGLSNIYVSPAFAMFGRYNNWNMGPGMMGGWGMGWVGMIFMIIFWGLVVFAVVSLIRWLIQAQGSRDRLSGKPGAQAMEILKERYARGEITRDEFESIKKEILH